MEKVTEAHTEKETLSVAVNIPSHEERKTTALFERTRKPFEDVIKESMSSHDALAMAPRSENQRFRMPRILDEEAQ